MSTCSQKLRLAAQPAGMATVWLRVLVVVVPVPSKEASCEPEWGVAVEPMVAVPVHDVAPLSKPGLASFCPGDAQVPPPPPPAEEPCASQAVALRARAASLADGSLQPL